MNLCNQVTITDLGIYLYVCVYLCLDGGAETVDVYGLILTLNVTDLQDEIEVRPPVGNHPAQNITRVLLGGRECNHHNGSEGLT